MPALDQLLLLIEQNFWQDAALSTGNIFFCLTLIPMFRHPGRPPLLTCIPTALALLAGGFVFATLHLWVTALTQTITGLQWLALAFKKSRQSRRRSGRSAARIWTSCLVLLVAVIAASSWAPCKAASGPEIEAKVQATLSDFLHKVGHSGELAKRSVAILVFPTVVKAGIGIGGEYGEGALQIRGQTAGYYNIISGSIGFQLGAQARSVIIMFMTEQALAQFQATDGWKVGIDGSITIIAIGFDGAIDTNSITSPIVGFVFDQKGLMYNLTLEGSKISRIYP
jgi:lipid-binding SYLF domain-containing protein